MKTTLKMFHSVLSFPSVFLTWVILISALLFRNEENKKHDRTPYCPLKLSTPLLLSGKILRKDQNSKKVVEHESMSRGAERFCIS